MPNSASPGFSPLVRYWGYWERPVFAPVLSGSSYAGSCLWSPQARRCTWELHTHASLGPRLVMSIVHSSGLSTTVLLCTPGMLPAVLAAGSHPARAGGGAWRGCLQFVRVLCLPPPTSPGEHTGFLHS